MIKLVYSEVRGLHQAAYVLALFAFGSQLLALVRDRMLAHQFGAATELDIYYAAFKVPDLLYVLFASTLSVYVLIPFVTTCEHNEDGEGARHLLSQVFSVFLVGYTILAAVLFVCVPYIMPKLFPGLTDHVDTLTLVTRILLIQPMLLGVSSLFGVVTQLGHRFVLYAISPLVYNIGIIIGLAALYPAYGLAGLAVGVVLGACGHMLVQWPLVRTSAFAFSFTRSISWKTIRSVLAVSIPRAVTLSLHQLTLLVLISLASVMTVGSVSVFQFAYNLQSVPLAIVGASYSIAAFPMLADLFAQKKYDVFARHVISAMRHIIFWSVPIAGLIIVLRAHIVRVVLGSGAFDWSDTKLVAAVLAILCLSLVAQAINLLIVRTFYAAGKTGVPLLVTGIGSVATMMCAGVLYSWYQVHDGGWLPVVLRIDDVVGSEVIVLALAYAVSLILQTACLVCIASWQFSIDVRWWPMHVLRALAAAVAGAVAAYATLQFVVVGINQETFIGIFIQGLLAGLIGIVGVVLTYIALRSPEVTEVLRSVRGRIFKTDVVAPQDTTL